MFRKDYYTISTCSPNIYRIGSPEGVYMDLFVGNTSALLLDTGQGFGDLRAAVRSVTQLPLTVVNTHGHYDHCNGNAQFPDCDIYMHEADWPVYDYYCQPENRIPVIHGAKKKRVGWNSDKTVNILPDDFDENAYIHQTPVALKPLKEGMIFDLGGITLKVMETPGHTKGSCALLHREAKNLYVGDAANSHIVLCIFAAPVSDYISTLNKLLALDFIKMRPAHETHWLDKSVLEDYLDCITHPDADNFIQASSDVRPDEQDYMYIRRGYSVTDSQKPGFASFIVKHPIPTDTKEDFQ